MDAWTLQAGGLVERDPAGEHPSRARRAHPDGRVTGGALRVEHALNRHDPALAGRDDAPVVGAQRIVAAHVTSRTLEHGSPVLLQMQVGLRSAPWR